MGDGAQGAYGTKSVGTSASVIAAARFTRTALLVQNVHASQDLYVGSDASVATTTGIKVAAGASMMVHTRGDVYGIASGASTDVRYLEVF